MSVLFRKTNLASVDLLRQLADASAASYSFAAAAMTGGTVTVAGSPVNGNSVVPISENARSNGIGSA